MKKRHTFYFGAILACSSLLFGCASSQKAAESTASSTSDPYWEYHGIRYGQYRWAKLSDDYKSCNGQIQSPVNIKIKNHMKDDTLPYLTFSYKQTPAIFENNGHTVQIPVEPGNTLNIGDKIYNLVQFHYHQKSEHEIDNDSFPLEMHFVHQALDGSYAVVGVLFKLGEENPFLAKYLSFFPLEKDEKKTDLTNPIELASVLPESKTYFHYAGSLTTPPCSETVQWHILLEKLTLSNDQLEQIKAIKALDGNHRRTQDLNGRPIKVKFDYRFNPN